MDTKQKQSNYQNLPKLTKTPKLKQQVSQTSTHKTTAVVFKILKITYILMVKSTVHKIYRQLISSVLST